MERTMAKRAEAAAHPSGTKARVARAAAERPATRRAKAATSKDPATPAGRANASGVAFVEPRVLPIQKATDLGSVQVLKHGNLYLLTDPFGDIHPDSRGLGLYLSDTRMLSCCSLRVGGTRPVLLQGSMGANYRGSINLTNPSADRNPDAK